MSWKSIRVVQDREEQAKILGLDFGSDKPPNHAKERVDGNTDRLIEEPCGLALSGGGIRSATFNLGLIQALDQFGVLGGFHYLSTVSGGGYVGGFWSAWRSRRRAHSGPVFADAESKSIRHLRSFSNFLRPRLSLISFETGRLATAVLVGIVPTLLVSVAVILAALLGWLGLAWLLMEPPVAYATLASAVMLLIAYGMFHLMWLAWSKERTVPPERLCFSLWMLILVGLATLLWSLLWYLVPLPLALRLAPVRLEDVSAAHWTAAVLPSVCLLVPILLLVLVRAAITQESGTFRRRRVVLGSLESALDRTLFLALTWLGIGLLWVGGQVVAGSGLSGVMGALSVSGAGGGVFVWARRFLRPQPNKPGGGRVLAALGTSSVQMVAYLTLLATVLLVAALISTVLQSFGWGGALGLVVVTSSLLLLPFLFDPQEVGFHSFYRQRLARAYLGAAADPVGLQEQGSATLECPSDDLPLSGIPPGRPLQLICCAANDLAGDPIESLHRGADSAVLSSVGFQVGDVWKPWDENRLAPSLSSAMTASAAAFNSHMGALSMKLGQAATFLLTALNLRLGLWLDNPATLWSKKFHLPPFFRELFGLSNAQAPEVYLSDGAHFENLGLYELIRRRCRFIVVSDCGADPDYAFDDFANAVRRARTDLSVEIDLDTESLRPDDDGTARQSVVSGTVMYPGGTKGVLILVKPVLTGDEPADVRQYARRNADFPQETTADQFYDEEQWESYRRLGEHVMASALQQVSQTLPETQDPQIRLRWALAQGSLQLAPRLELDESRCLEAENSWNRLEFRLARDGRAADLAADVLGGGVGKPRTGRASSRPEDLAGALRYIRLALHLMESVLRTHHLDGSSGTQSVSWFNRMGRWATSEAFRGWWPWLAPTVSRRLKQFLGLYFSLDSVRTAAGRVRPVAETESGYAIDRWRRLKSPEPEQAEPTGNAEPAGSTEPRLYGYFLSLDGVGSKVELMAAFAAVCLETADDGHSARISWQRRDLYIPPGLWATGIADAFVPKLCERLIKDHAGKKYTAEGLQLRAHFDTPPEAAELNVYSGAGFRFDGMVATRSA